ncbi:MULTISPECIES: PilN domain-containing protein [unclassified Massilia]|uniref:PilN domain-containing protein n=1 Tax=unclassified Massilia TaxID=2609279 RepID=UPI001780337C|nr:MULTISPECIES: PilN domain-containing protein [unclassified Massilia]MBD8533321.1 PilN domain-containing protein [Massilia sp. CFBP 13647]MBD8676721.1 PilN domain-containing protein [Massilia sp. CFBP 13721]
MIRINLLPHREAKRKQKQAAFVAMLVLGGLLGAAIVLMVGGWNASRIAIQEERNAVLSTENAELDKKIKDIATLKEEINALKSRQQAVEDLQGDRNQPVYLFDELVRQTPEGVYLKGFEQDGQRVVLNGYAQSQERVAELLRNLSGNSPWLERPDLTEVKAATLTQNKVVRKAVEFTLAVAIKRARESEEPEDGKAKTAAGSAKAEGSTP